LDSEPAPATGASERPASAVAHGPTTGRSWVFVVLVGVPLLEVLAVGLRAIGLNNTATGLGASILAVLVAGKGAGIHGAVSWLVAWLVIFVLAGLLGLLLLPWDLPG
jgi:hypothetical protein